MRGSRKHGSKLMGLTGLAVAFSFVVAPAALAQSCVLVSCPSVPDVTVPDTGNLTDPVKDVVDPVTDVVSDPVGSLPDTGGVTDPVKDVVRDPVGSLPDTGPVTDPVTDIVRDPVGNLPDTGGATDPVKDVVRDPVGSLPKTTDSVVKEIEKALGGNGGGSGSTVQRVADAINNTISDVLGTLPDGAAGDTPVGKIAVNGYIEGHQTLVDGYGSGGGRDGSSFGRDGSHALAEQLRSETLSAEAASARSDLSLLERAAEFAGEVAAKLAFPMALLVMVGAYLVLHGRIGRKDPKLALAPVDAEQELLTFQ